MAANWRNVAGRARECAGALWLRWEQFASESKTILAVTNNFSCRSTLRVLSIEEGWRILFADSLEDGLRLQNQNRVGVLVYDRNLSGVDWKQGLRTLLSSDEAVFPIVISDVLTPRLRSEVLYCGGFDLARNPLEPKDFAALVNGAWALAKSIDSLEA
jgi:DNA-binding response OmpR family regulator